VAASPPRVREAGVADLEALIDTRVALFRDLGQGPLESAVSEFRDRCREIMADLLRDGRAAAWLAVTREDAVRGAAILLEYPRLPSPRNLRTREGYALSVYVAPEARRQGVASTLMAAAIEEARRRGLARIRLHATPQGSGVYERLGFTRRDDEMELEL
jgi:ribosomal protein S18 acetylase RimI-like enzyme